MKSQAQASLGWVTLAAVPRRKMRGASERTAIRGWEGPSAMF